MEIKYYKEFQHNYMVIRCNGSKENGYQQKILTRQKMKYIFPCDIRYMNGESFYYYEITSKVSIKNLYHNVKWKRENIIKLFHDLQEAINELSSYLLDDSQLVIESDYIYYDYENEKYVFLYYPGYEVGIPLYEELLSFILDSLDVDDGELTDFMYQICGEIGTGSLTLQRINALLSNMNSLDKESDKIEIHAEEFMDDISMAQYKADDINITSNENLNHVLKRTKQSIFSRLLIGIAIVGEFIIGSIFIFFITTETEKVILLAGGVTCLVMLLLGILLLVREKKMQRQKNRNDAEIKAYRDNEFELNYEMGNLHMDDFMQKRTANAITEKDACGSLDEQNQTVFFENKKPIEEYKLFAMDKGNKQHISLLQLPCVIGKLAGCVDVCIKDQSVSRMHARVERQENHLYIQDINSTNGTYLNGIRLEPNEKVEITLGDEIRFGNLNYSVR